MSIFARSTPSYAPAPAGAHAAVCCDVVDLGELEITYSGQTKKQHKINIVWQIDEDRDDGKPHQVRKRYTCSLHEKASLRKDLESWRGRAFSDEELQGFDLEVLIGFGCMVNVIHASQQGKIYANVAAVMRLAKGMPTPVVRDYVRVCERAPEEQSQEVPWNPEITMDDVPF